MPYAAWPPGIPPAHSAGYSAPLGGAQELFEGRSLHPSPEDDQCEKRLRYRSISKLHASKSEVGSGALFWRDAIRVPEACNGKTQGRTQMPEQRGVPGFQERFGRRFRAFKAFWIL